MPYLVLRAQRRYAAIAARALTFLLTTCKKRKRRDYRIARKAAFARPEPGFSLYEGRTRGKKLKYTYSDDEDIFSDELPSTRRSTRNASGISTPAEPAGPRYTASGRQIRAPAGGVYGESLLSGQRGEEAEDTGRPQRSRATRANGYTDYNMDDESDAGHSSGNEWQGGEEEEDNDFEGDDEGDLSGDESVINGQDRSLVVQLRYGKGKLPSSPREPAEKPSADNLQSAHADTADSSTAPETQPTSLVPNSETNRQTDTALAQAPTVDTGKVPSVVLMNTTAGEQKVDPLNEVNGQQRETHEVAEQPSGTDLSPNQLAPINAPNETG